MRVTLTKHSLLLLVILLVACTGQLAPGTPLPPSVTDREAGLFTDAEGDLPTPDDPTIIRTRFVYVNLDPLGGAGNSAEGRPAVANVLVLNPFEDVVFTAVLDRVELSSSGSLYWIGHVEGVEYSQVTLVVKDRVMVGNITTPGAFYQVRYASNGVHAVHQIDQAAFPPEAEPVAPD